MVSRTFTYWFTRKSSLNYIHSLIFLLNSSDDLPNLVDYAIRMKEHFWPDWDKSLAGAQVQLPTTS